MANERLDKWDYLLSISSGALTASLDVFFISDLDILKAHENGAKKANEIIINTARKNGFNGEKDDTAKAIEFLEKKFPYQADKVTDKFGGGYYHHLRDFAHHPSLLGLVFSLVEQFTGVAYGTDVNGVFKAYEIPDWKPRNPRYSIFTGTYTWIMHLISDIGGSSGTVGMGKEGTGIPGPMMSFIKEVSSIPGIRSLAGKNGDGQYILSKTCQKLFDGTLLGFHDEDGKIIKGKEVKFDFRTEIGLAEQIVDRRQYIPVLLCEMIISAFYTVRQLIVGIRDNNIHSVSELRLLDFKQFLPWNSKRLTHMRMLSASTFSTIDISAAGIRAAAKHPNSKADFAREFLQGINYFGIARLSLSALGEMGIVTDKLYTKFLELAEKGKQKIGEKIPRRSDVVESSKDLTIAATTIAGIGSPVGFVGAAIGVYQEISTSIKEYHAAKEERIIIEKECAEQIEIINEYRNQIELVTSEYMLDRLLIFDEALSMMDEAVKDNDSELFIRGNTKIQQKLGKTDGFGSQQEFDDLMDSDSDFKM